MENIQKDKNYQRCSKGMWDTTVPGITFDENGESNYSKMFTKYSEQYPGGSEGKKVWEQHLANIKANSKGKKYDCIIGVSGGTDSSYLMHLAKKEYGLNPLAVTFDNGWSSDISVKNIKKMCQALDIDLETYVVDYEEMKDLLKSYIKSSLPWVDFPTDHAIKSVLFQTAKREGIKHILIGHDFRSEGSQPNEWTYSDDKQLKFIQKKFGTEKLKTYPNISFFKYFWLNYVKKIKMLYPFFFVDYNKQDAQKLLIEQYDWEYYGGHHHENMFTKFAIANWLPNKFGIDKRIITYSAQVRSGRLSREEAIEILSKPACTKEDLDKDKNFIIKKLGMTEVEFEEYWNRPNKSFTDYPSHHHTFERIYKLVMPIMKYILPQMPAYFIQMEMRDKQKNEQK
jgi:N-acetyl sugar amidotransferase